MFVVALFVKVPDWESILGNQNVYQHLNGKKKLWHINKIESS